MNDFIKWLEKMSAQLPALPPKWKEFIVKIAPYLAIISLLATGQAFFIFFNVTLHLGEFGQLIHERVNTLQWYWIYLVVQACLYLAAIKPLFRRSIQGWNYVFYASLLAGIAGLINGNLIGVVISLAISLYFLFQVRPLYTGHAHVVEHHSTKP